jgi:hypothetical protein
MSKARRCGQEAAMALQLGALRDALIDAGVSKEKAEAASEEVAGYENRLTRLSTMVQVAIGILVLLLGSQAALWAKAGEVGGQLAEMHGQIAGTHSQIEELHAQNAQILGQLAQIAHAIR